MDDAGSFRWSFPWKYEDLLAILGVIATSSSYKCRLHIEVGDRKQRLLSIDMFVNNMKCGSKLVRSDFTTAKTQNKLNLIGA